MPFSVLVICLFVAVLDLPCFVWALSDCSEWRLLPGCARTAHTLSRKTRASEEALGTRASAAAAPLGSAVRQQVDQTHVPCIGWQTLNHWATGGPGCCF